MPVIPAKAGIQCLEYMFSLIQTLRKKSEAEKKSIAFLSALALTGIIAFFWFVSLVTTAEPKERLSTKEPGPTAAMFQNITDMIGDTIFVFKDAKDKLFAPTTVVPQPATE